MTFDFNKLVTIGFNKWKTAPFRFYGEKEPFFIGNKIEQNWRDIILSGNTALTLVNAKANGLNYVKLFGACEQRDILPSEYQRVEYLESTGTQYINTGVVVNTLINPRIVTTFKTVSAGDIDCWGTNNTNANTILWNLSNSASLPAWYVRWGTMSTRQLTNQSDLTSFKFTDFHTLDVGGVDVKQEIPIKIDGVLVNTMVARADADLSNTGTILIFRGRSTGINQFKDFAIYSNNVLIQKLIPCRRKSNNVLGMYDTVTGNFLTNSGTGTFTAGADVTAPSPDTPMDIWCNNGVVKANKNLYWTEYHGYHLSQSDGITVSANGGVNVSGMVDCRTIKSFKITTTSPQGSFRIFKYGADNTFIDAISTGNMGNIVTLEDNVGFFRIQYNFTSGGTNTENILIYDSAYNLGSIYTDGTQEKVEVTGKNLLNNPVYTLGYLSNNGIISGSDGTVLNFYPVSPNTTYTFTYTKGINNDYYDRICGYSSNNVSTLTELLVQKDFRSYSIGDRLSSTFTTGVNTNYIVVGMLCGNSPGVAPTDAQLELGSTATTYKPYFNGGTATAENLFKVGTYQDVQSVIDGSVTRNVGVDVLKGTDDEVYIKNGSRYYYTPLNILNEGNIRSANLLCSHFLNSTTGIEGNCFKYSVQIYFYPNMTLCPDATAFKQWLADQYNAGTPVTIVYPLATATTETVTAQPLSIQAGTNIITAEGSIDNLPLEVSYKAGVAVTITEVQNTQLDNNVEVTING